METDSIKRSSSAPHKSVVDKIQYFLARCSLCLTNGSGLSPSPRSGHTNSVSYVAERTGQLLTACPVSIRYQSYKRNSVSIHLEDQRTSCSDCLATGANTVL